jgi:hypothetical protein
MNRTLTALVLGLCPLLVAAQDGASVARLEQEVRQLQREVLNLTQQLGELRARVDRPSSPAFRPPPAGALTAPGATPAAGTASASAPSARWIDARRWQSLRPGMSELEVLEILGPPTSMRGEAGERVLLYALEIGNAGFLAGSVTLRDRVASTIETPRLK